MSGIANDADCGRLRSNTLSRVPTLRSDFREGRPCALGRALADGTHGGLPVVQDRCCGRGRWLRGALTTAPANAVTGQATASSPGQVVAWGINVAGQLGVPRQATLRAHGNKPWWHRGRTLRRERAFYRGQHEPRKRPGGGVAVRRCLLPPACEVGPRSVLPDTAPAAFCSGVVSRPSQGAFFHLPYQSDWLILCWLIVSSEVVLKYLRRSNLGGSSCPGKRMSWRLF